MTKTEILLIRACKAQNPIKRIFSIYKRFYFKHATVEGMRWACTDILANIIDNYIGFTLYNFIGELNKDWDMFAPRKDINQVKIFDTLIIKIRYTKVSDLPKDFIKPRQFK